MHNNLNHDFGSAALSLKLLLVGLAVYPFFINPIHQEGLVYRETIHSQASTTIASMFGTAPEYIWIWPRVLLTLSLGLLGLLLLPSGKRLQRKVLPILLLVYLMLVLTSSLLSNDDNWNYQLLGGVGRLDGPLYQLGLVLFGIFAFVTISLSKKLRVLHAVALVIALSSIAETALAILQRLGIDLVGQIINGSRYPAIVGSIGNPGMVAGFLIVGLFSALWLAENSTGASLFWHYALALIISTGIGVAANRTTFIAVLLALIILLILYKSHRSNRLLALVIFIAGAFIITPAIPNNIGVEKHLANTSTLRTRLHIWKISVEAILKTQGQPFIGAGPDGLLLTVAKHIPIEELVTEYRIEYGWPKGAVIKEIRPLFKDTDPVRSRAFMITLLNDPAPGQEHRIIFRYNMDKAHNLFLDRAVNYGVISALIWLFLYLFPIWVLYRKSDTASAYLLAGTLALFIYYLAWFPVPQTEPIHLTWLVLAWVWAEATRNKAVDRHV